MLWLGIYVFVLDTLRLIKWRLKGSIQVYINQIPFYFLT